MTRKPFRIEALEAQIHTATRCVLLGESDAEILEQLDADGPEVQLDQLRSFTDAMTRTRAKLAEYRAQHDLCPLHARDVEICQDDRDEECRSARFVFGFDSEDTADLLQYEIRRHRS